MKLPFWGLVARSFITVTVIAPWTMIICNGLGVLVLFCLLQHPAKVFPLGLILSLAATCLAFWPVYCLGSFIWTGRRDIPTCTGLAVGWAASFIIAFHRLGPHITSFISQENAVASLRALLAGLTISLGLITFSAALLVSCLTGGRGAQTAGDGGTAG